MFLEEMKMEVYTVNKCLRPLQYGIWANQFCSTAHQIRIECISRSHNLVDQQQTFLQSHMKVKDSV